MGCSDCRDGAGACDARKAAQRALLDGILARLYPPVAPAGRPTWGRPDDEARFRAGVPRAEARRLFRALSSVTEAPAWFRPGEPDDLCDFVWILCVGRRPSLFEVREGLAALDPAEAAPLLEEKHLVVALSSVARIATVQEVALTRELDGEGLAWVRETPRAGVFDPVLLARLQKTVALLEASDVAHVDFDLLEAPWPAASPGDYGERWGVEPCLSSFLFYAAPPTTTRITAPAAWTRAPVVRR